MAAAHAYAPGPGADGGLGFGGRFRIDGERQPAVISPGYVARVKMEGVDDDRAFLGFVRRVRALATDKRVAGVLLKIEELGIGMARIEEVRDLVALLRARGKPTFRTCRAARRRGPTTGVRGRRRSSCTRRGSSR